ncbi:MAG: DNA starvation/stationary phase protection protein [Chloroflexota bacterium]|nr:DNA starvation/stationary phase protection protein [Chloroflexota bacterium]
MDTEMATGQLDRNKPNIGLPDNARSDVCAILNGRLADVFVLYTKTRNYHWNVTGPRFQPLHEFFEEQYELLDETMDEMAERVRQLGGKAAGSLDQFLRLTQLREDTNGVPTEDQMLTNLLNDHEAIIRQLREDVDFTANCHDAGTSDFLTGIMEQHEKMAWMLRSFLNV